MEKLVALECETDVQGGRPDADEYGRSTLPLGRHNSPTGMPDPARSWGRVIGMALSLLLLFPNGVQAQVTEPLPLGPDLREQHAVADLVDYLMAHMTAADKVGQLFVVPVAGTEIAPADDVLELIHVYRVGGVILSERNQNWDNRSGTDTPRQVARLTGQLQAAALGYFVPSDAVLRLSTDKEPVTTVPALSDLPSALGIPLWIGAAMREEGQLQPSLRNGFTPQPSQMALGATWDPTFARAMGTILGQELQAVGINLLLGPDLDIIGPDPPLSAHLSTTAAFGGDSWWAGQNGRAFIQGVQDGSNRRLLAFARHFPGQGARDRLPDQELATIQGNLEDLRRGALVPFAQAAHMVVREPDMWPVGTAHGFVTSHVRYSGFLRARERTPPISLSTQLGEMLALEEFQDWRQQGGLLLSDALGVRAIRRYYDPSGASFLAQRIANDAFQAGNDLLWLDQYEDGADTVAIRETVEFFQTQYREKPDFALAVDESVRHILQAKLQIFPLRALSVSAASLEAESHVTTAAGWVPGPAVREEETNWVGFHLQDVVATEADLAAFASESMAFKRDVVTRVAQAAVTLLHSNWSLAGDRLPTAPSVNDRLVIFTDSRLQAACLLCSAESILGPEMAEQSILRLFGPEATRQMAPNRLASFTLSQLLDVLNQAADGSSRLRVDRALNNADWIIFAMLNVDVEEHPSSDAVSQFLRQRGDLAAEKRLVVLAFDAPFALDGTDISKLTAYIGAYSPAAAFVDAAVRALFRDLEFQGAPPVSVPGTRYSSLIERLEPDPDQVIPLTLSDEKRSDFALDRFDVHLGDTIVIKAGPIVDRNGHPVPDGTPVQFFLKYSGSGLNLWTEPVPSENGYGMIEVLLDRPEILEVAAGSIDSRTSVTLQINVGAEKSALITSVEPDMPLSTAPDPTVQVQVPNPGSRPDSVSWFALAIGQFLSSFLLLGVCLATYCLVVRTRMTSDTMMFRMLWASVAGAMVYLLYGIAGEPILGGAVPSSLYSWMAAPVTVLSSLLILTVLHRRT